MTDTSVTTGTGSRPRKPRERLSWARYSQMFRTNNADLFDPFDKDAIRDAMIDHGLPPSVLADILDTVLGLDRAALDPHYEKKRKPSRTEAERFDERRAAAAKREEVVAETRARSDRVTLRKIGPDMIMDDGRRLGAWTVGELRKLNGVFAFILKKAGARDDGRTVDAVMKTRDWRKAPG